MVYGGTEAIAAVLGRVEGLAKNVVPNLPPLATMIGPLVQAEFRLTTSTALDMNAPLPDLTWMMIIQGFGVGCLSSNGGRKG